jgi:hypothetical protein
MSTRVTGTDALLGSDRVGVRARIAFIAEVLGTYAHVRRLLAGHGITEVVGRLRDGTPDRLDHETACRLAERLYRPVRRTLRPLPFDTRCLMRSLVLLAMLARRGAHCQLVLAAEARQGFAAHAWISHAGRPILPTLGYAPLTAI